MQNDEGRSQALGKINGLERLLHRAFALLSPELRGRYSKQDWVSGRDKVLDAVLADRSAGVGEDVSEDRAFYFARKSQSAEWKPFWLA